MWYNYLMPAVKKSIIKRVKEESEENSEEKLSLESKPLINKNKPRIILLLIILLVFAFLYYFKGLFIAAVVNGQPISRLVLIRDVEKQLGKQTLDSLVTKTLIFQEAKKQNIAVSDNEINNEIKKVEESINKQGQNLDQVLALQGMTKNDLIEQIKLQKIIEKMVGKDIKITDKEINDYIEKNKSLLPQNKKPEEIKALVKQQLEQQKLGEKFQPWLDNLKKNSKIYYFVNY